VSDREKEREAEERAWDREMAQVDKLLAKLPTYQSARPASARAHGGDPTVRAPSRPGAGVTTGVMWGRLLLGLVLAAGMAVWPYGTVCGAKLMYYLGGAAMVVVAGLWSASATWQRRSGPAHALSLLVMIWGLALIAHGVLPRTGYSAQRAVWMCPEPAASAPRR
jgi:hypothetical protein